MFANILIVFVAYELDMHVSAFLLKDGDVIKLR